MNLTIEKGEYIVLCGKSGSGKSTILALLARFYDVDSGAVYVDGKDIRTLTRASLRKAYTMVLQDTWLFCGTVHDNIAYGRDGATREDVIAAAKAARIHSFIECLPQGYDTILTDEGTNISKGQKQLLTIARAILSNPSLLILDEATSSVDTRTEMRIQQAMVNLMKNRTSLIIAHRLSTIRNSDVIVVMQNGRIVQQGTHDELVSTPGVYLTLYEKQRKMAKNM